MNTYRLILILRRINKYLYTIFIKGCFKTFGSKVDIDPSFYFENPEKIVISSDVEIRKGVVLIGRSKEDIGIYLDTGVHIKEYACLDAYGGYIKLGKGVRIGHHTVIAGHGGVEFDDFSGVGGLSYIIAANHTYSDPNKPFVEQPETKKGIRIGKNTWGASGIIITDGVTIGNNVVIGAGSVVRKDVPDNALVLGNPAKIVFFHNL